MGLKSSKNGLSVSRKTEFLCLFAIQNEVTGEKSSDLGGNYLKQRRLLTYGNLTSFALTSQLQDSLNKSRTSKK